MRIAAITTFSEDGYRLYAERMIRSFAVNWPAPVTLHVYPDKQVSPPPDIPDGRIVWHYREIPERTALFSRWWGDPKATGETPEGYNYRFDLLKFSHKPMVIHDFMSNVAPYMEKPPGWLIWLDADIVTHAPIPLSVLKQRVCGLGDVAYMGRPWKYSECGFIVFRLPDALVFMERMVGLYTSGAWQYEKEWHDSYLFDRVRESFENDPAGSPLSFVNMASHLKRKTGGHHPIVNTFLGAYLDHAKGQRKRTGPKPGDRLLVDDSPYWQAVRKRKGRA